MVRPGAPVPRGRVGVLGQQLARALDQSSNALLILDGETLRGDGWAQDRKWDAAQLPERVDFQAQLSVSVAMQDARPPFFNFEARIHAGEHTVARARLQVMTKREFA